MSLTQDVTGQSLPRLALIIPTYGRESVLIETIQQVLDLHSQPDEILVVDQSSQHDAATQQSLDSFSREGRIRWIHHSPPNLPGARNRAAQETSCEIMLFIDDDVVLPGDFVLTHLRHYADPGVDAVVGQVYEYEVRTDGGTERKVLVPRVPVQAKCAQPADFLRGGNFSVRRSAFIAVQGFDESFVGAASYEENDFARRLLKAGHRIMFDPHAPLTHLRVPSGGCRVPGNKSMPEWQKTASLYVFLFRHSLSRKERKQILRGVFRAGPLRKENVVNPTRWLPAAWAMVRAFIYGWRRAQTGVRSPFSPRP